MCIFLKQPLKIFINYNITCLFVPNSHLFFQHKTYSQLGGKEIQRTVDYFHVCFPKTSVPPSFIFLSIILMWLQMLSLSCLLRDVFFSVSRWAMHRYSSCLVNDTNQKILRLRYAICGGWGTRFCMVCLIVKGTISGNFHMKIKCV